MVISHKFIHNKLGSVPANKTMYKTCFKADNLLVHLNFYFFYLKLVMSTCGNDNYNKSVIGMLFSIVSCAT